MEGRTITIKRQKTKIEAQILEDEKQDYLNELPEPLVHHVLSYLTMKDVVRMSVIAKKWRYVWLSVACLNFSPMKMPKDKETDFIEQCLRRDERSKIQKMVITYYYQRGDAHHFDSWIRFALTRNVEELHLDFLERRRGRKRLPYNYYRLPDFIFSSTSLTVLTLKRCFIGSPINFKLSSLKILTLKRVYFSDESTSDLISSCPNLECLSLTVCNSHGGHLDVSIMNVGMKILKIHDKSDIYPSSSLEVYAPFIVSFKLVTEVRWENYVIKKMGSLQSASFDCKLLHGYFGQPYSEETGCAFDKTIKEVAYVKDLSLCGCYVQAMSIREEQSLDISSLSFGVTCLRITTGLTKGGLQGISYMLRHSPKIETLIINIDERHATSNCNSKDAEYWIGHEQDFIGLLDNLKTIKIYNFMYNLAHDIGGSKTTEEFLEQLQYVKNFLRFLLKNSKVLERMNITMCKYVKILLMPPNVLNMSETKKLKLLSQLTQELLAFPRVSLEPLDLLKYLSYKMED